VTYPALDVLDVPSDLLLALVDDFSPTAVSEDGLTTTCFFADAGHRDAARDAIAREACGVDVDRDAIQNATENLADNPAIDHVRFEVGDVRDMLLEPADVVTANLTGALLVQSAELLRRFVRPGGALILSGLLRHERDEVVNAYVNGRGSAVVVWEDTEDDWVGLALNVPGRATV
jgi:ribosomal protein L11 methyltransferase